MTPLSDKELEDRLTAVGNSLLKPPSSVDELLPLLDQIEELLSKVEQSPAKTMQTALSPLMKALVAEELVKHSDVDVKVGVAACISEITRITAPDAPYDDEKMKDIFQLIVSSFENLSDISSRSYEKRATILETVAKVRSCVIMLDLECDQLIIEMFQHFLKAIRAYHAEVIFASMETIMTLVLEESEEISPDLLSPILSILKRDNEAVIPIAKKLGERVIQNTADKLRPYLMQTVKSLDASFDEYSEVVASVCGENIATTGNSNESILKDQPVAKDGGNAIIQDKDSNVSKSPKPIASNGINETGTEQTSTDTNSSKKADPNQQTDAKSISELESDAKPVDLEAKGECEGTQQVPYNPGIPSEEDVQNSPSNVKTVEAAKVLDKVEESTIQLSPSKELENEAAIAGSPAQSGSLPDESQSEKDNVAKRKENLVREEVVSADTTSVEASEGENSSETEKQQSPGKNLPDETADKDKSPADDDSTSDSEARSPDQTEKPGKAIDMSEDESSLRKKDVKLSGRGKSASDKNVVKCTSDSEGRSPDQTEKLGNTIDKSEDGSSLRKKDVKLSGRGKSTNDKNVVKCTSDSEGRSSYQTENLGNATDKSEDGSSLRKKDVKLSGRGKSLSDKNVVKCTSDSEGRSPDQTEKLGNAIVKSEDGSSLRKKDVKSSGRGKSTSDKNVVKCTSDSEARSPDQTEKLGNAIVKSEDGSSSRKKDVKLSGRGKSTSDKNVVKCTSDSEVRSPDQTEKLGDTSDKSEDESPLRKKDVKLSGRMKSTSDKNVVKSSARADHGKATVASPRSPLKSTKDEVIQEETPKMSNKRKRTSSTEKGSDTLEYSENLVGSKVKVWWPKDRMYYEGVITSFDSVKKKHKVDYVDGDEEVLNLRRERWEFIGDDLVSDEDHDAEHSSHDASPDMQRKKKGNKSAEASSKRRKMEGSVKSKVKETATKSGGKSKDDVKAESESKDHKSKLSKKSVDDTIKPKDHSQKLGSKSQGDSSKASGKSKNDGAKTPGNSKQDSQKSAKSKGKTPQSGKSLTASGTKTTKSSTSKAKETDRIIKDKVAESAKSSESTKGKPTDTAKPRESESKSGKKRRR